MRSLSRATRFFQPRGGELRDPVEPARIELGADVVLEEVLARDAVAFGEPHHAAFEADQALVDVVELLDQGIDARLVQPQRLHLGDDLFLELLVFALLGRRQRRALELELDVLVLQAAQALVGIRDVVEGFQHLGLELGLDGGERHRAFEVVLVEFALRRLSRLLSTGHGVGLGPERGCGRRRGRGRDRLRLTHGADHHAAGAVIGTFGGGQCGDVLGVGAGIGRLEVDDVAQEHLAVVELVAPDDDGLEGQRALAQARDHRLAAGLDALGNGDFALARKQLDRTHFAQIHAHGVVGALARLGFLGLGRRGARDLDEFALALFLFGFLARLLGGFLGLGLLGLDDVDAHLVEHREHVLDLVGGHLLGGQHRIDLFMGDIAPLLGGLDHLADRGIGEV